MKEFFEHFRSSIPRRCSCAGIIRNVINGSVFLLKDFSLYLGKTKLDALLMTKIQASIKKDEIIVFVINNKVLLQMQLNLH
jgi:hypothetical protein